MLFQMAGLTQGARVVGATELNLENAKTAGAITEEQAKFISKMDNMTAKFNMSQRAANAGKQLDGYRSSDHANAGTLRTISEEKDLGKRLGLIERLR